MPTTDRRYEGLCIGGPVAGQFKVSDRPDFAVVPNMDMGSPMAFDLTTPLRSVRYVFVQGLRWRDEERQTEDALNFWIPSTETWNPLECVRQMAEDYANYHDLRNS